ncbi:MAG: hypothetical protein R3217_01160 [Gammaproteobacteria bacterium]|nr:hypothetical protein [Gammaproteobacteria bacterium]
MPFFPARDTAIGSVLTLLAFAVLWIITYSANTLLDPLFFKQVGVSWLFIPAGIRLLAVIVGRWQGALGIMLGTLATNLYLFSDPYFIYGAALLSGLGPLLVLYLLELRPGFRDNLVFLSIPNLIALCMMFAAINVALTQVFFLAIGITDPLAFAGAATAMFVGDFSGSVLVMVLVFPVARKFGLLKHPPEPESD